MRYLITAAALIAALVFAAAATAITDGTPDGNGHANVGGLVSPTQYSDGTWIYCSGTLISPTVCLPYGRALRRGRRARGCDLRQRLPGRRQALLRQVPLRPALRPATERSARHRGRRLRQVDQWHHAGDAADGGLALRHLQHADVYVGGRRRVRGDHQPGGRQYLYDDVRMVATGTLNFINRSWLRTR